MRIPAVPIAVFGFHVLAMDSRQMTAPVAHRVMRENGVRFNDLGTFRRANHFPAAAGPAPARVNATAAAPA